MNDLEMTIIGSGDAFNSGGRNHTCFFIKSQLGCMLIDCGASACAGLKQAGINNEEIDCIVISHFHGDHYGGLPFFLLEAAVLKRKKPLTIISPPACKERLEQLLTLLYPGSSVLEKLTIHFKSFHPNGVRTAEHINILALPVIHKKATMPHGIRIHIGTKIISYSGDTEWTPNLEILAKDADLFICECNFYALTIKGHMNYKTLSGNLSALGYKRIMLTHFDNEMLQNLEKVELECAFDGLKILL